MFYRVQRATSRGWRTLALRSTAERAIESRDFMTKAFPQECFRVTAGEYRAV